MEVSIVLLISSITLFVGYIIGKKEGLSNGYTKGIQEGEEETLKLEEKYSVAVLTLRIEKTVGPYKLITEHSTLRVNKNLF